MWSARTETYLAQVNAEILRIAEGSQRKAVCPVWGEDGVISACVFFERRGKVVFKYPSRALTNALLSLWDACAAERQLWRVLVIVIESGNFSVSVRYPEQAGEMHDELDPMRLVKEHFGADQWDDSNPEVREPVEKKRVWWAAWIGRRNNRSASDIDYTRCLGILDSIGKISLRFRSDSHDAVEEFRAAMEIAQGFSRSDIVRLRSDLGEDMSFKLMHLGVLAAERAMNTREPAWLRAALMGHVLEGFLLDPRENYLRLYAIEYAAYRARLDLKSALRKLAPLMDDFSRRNFANVFSSPHGAAALELSTLGIEAGADGELRFVQAQSQRLSPQVCCGQK